MWGHMYLHKLCGRETGPVCNLPSHGFCNRTPQPGGWQTHVYHLEKWQKIVKIHDNNVEINVTSLTCLFSCVLSVIFGHKENYVFIINVKQLSSDMKLYHFLQHDIKGCQFVLFCFTFDSPFVSHVPSVGFSATRGKIHLCSASHYTGARQRQGIMYVCTEG